MKIKDTSTANRKAEDQREHYPKDKIIAQR